MAGKKAQKQISSGSKRKRREEAQPQAPPEAPQRPPLTWKQRLLLVGFGLSLPLLGEILLRVAGIGKSDRYDPLAGFVEGQLFEQAQAANGTPLYRVTTPFREAFNGQEFPAIKEADTYRIFCLGGSSTFGYPTGAEIAFPRWLSEWLTELDSARRWEVLNVGGISYATHRVRRLMHELLEHEPDLLVLYSGHNEFVERNFYYDVLKGDRSTTRIDHSLRKHSRLYSLTRDLLAGAREDLNGEDGARRNDMGFEVVVERRTGRNTADSRAAAIAGYRANLEAMIAMCRERNVPLLLLTTPPNLRDWVPDGSAHRANLPPADLKAFDAGMAAGKLALNKDDPATALQHLRAIVALDEQHAEGWYRLGQALEKEGDMQAAADAYSQARDLDQLPTRALAGMAETIRAVGAESGTPVIDIVAVFAAEAANGLIGRSLIMDYVHPTVLGHQLIAREIADWMSQAGIAGTPAGIAAAARNLRPKHERLREEFAKSAEDAPTEQLNKAFALRGAGRLGEAIEAASQAARLLPTWGTAQYALGTLYYDKGLYPESEAALRQAIELDPEDDRAMHMLAALLMQLGRQEQAAPLLARAVEIRPDGADIRANYGKLLGVLERDAEAVVQLEAALRLDDTLVDSHTDLGVVLTHMDKPAQAIRHYRRVIELRPNDPTANFNLGNILIDQGEGLKGVELLEVVARAQPNFPGLFPLMGQALESQGRFDEASAVYERGVMMGPKNVHSLKSLAWFRATCSLDAQRDSTRALVIANRLVQVTGRTSAQSLAVLAAAQAADGNFAEAIVTAQAGLALAQTNELEPLVIDLIRHLELYRADKPVLEP